MTDENPAAYMERWQQLTARLADELARGYTLSRIAIEAEISTKRHSGGDFHQSAVGQGIAAARLHHWSIKPHEWREVRGYQEGALSPADEIEEKLTAYFAGLDEERATAHDAPPPLIETIIARKMFVAFDESRYKVRMVEISAMPGSGKTSGANLYIAKCRKAEGFNCPIWLHTFTTSNLSRRDTLYQMAHIIAPGKASITDKDFILETIIDEHAQNRRVSTLNRNVPFSAK